MTRSARRRARERANEILAELFLREVRLLVGLNQSELAARLGIRQPSLSKLESQRQSIQLDTLRRIVHALGGELDVIARFPKGSVRLAEFSEQKGETQTKRRRRKVELV